MYWTDAQLGAIYVAKDDGRNRARLIGGLSAPRGIVLVPTEGYDVIIAMATKSNLFIV